MRSRLVAALIILVAVVAGFCVHSSTHDAVAQTKQAKANDTVQKVIAPFITKHCVECHGPKKKNAGLALHIYTDEKSMLKDRRKWHEVMRMLTNGEMPPPEKKARPDLKEVEVVLKAINDVFHAADANGKRDPGRVTMRRLNRTEYNNTIRDLVDVDFKPADDFPADDVGYGFDNIGDVLSISPVLMERYLDAAETIMRQAIIVGELPKPNVRTMAARFLEPAVPNPDKVGRFRAVTETKKPLFTTYVLTQEGEFNARVRGYAKRAGDDPVKLSLQVNGKEVKTFEVKNIGSKAPLGFEVKLELKKGVNRVAAVLLNEFKDPKSKDERTLFVESIQLEGPLDTRPMSHRKIMAHKEGISNREAARAIITRFAGRAYRRPANKAEVDRLLRFVDQAEKNKQRWESGVQLALQAVLCSPKFLFRVELDDRPDSKDPHPIDDYQLASRLSYFLWASMPDDELLALAAKKQLHANIKPQVQRMLKDPKANSLVENFAVQWLQLRLLKHHTPDSKLFPDFDDNLRNAMIKETEMFIGAVIKEDRSILDLIDSNFTFMNDRLARHYGIADTNGNRVGQKPTAKAGTPFGRGGKFGGGKRGNNDEFKRVTFADSERGGLLTQASILTITSNPTRTSPVKRGKWVLEQILGTPPPPPPPDVPELVEKGQLKGTLRERMEQHRKNPSCANCHARLDPPGFAFENYDAIGKFRLKDGDANVDPSGVLPNGQKFNGPADLKKLLVEKKGLFSRALSEKLMTYAIGRGVEYYDKAAIDGIIAALAKNEYRFSTLVIATATSDPFRMRRGKDQKD